MTYSFTGMSFVSKNHAAKNDGDYIRELTNIFHHMIGMSKGKNTLNSECVSCYNLLNSYFMQNEKVITWVAPKDLYFQVYGEFWDAYSDRFAYTEEIRVSIEKIYSVLQEWNNSANFDSHKKNKRHRAQHWETRDTDMRNLLARLKNT